MSMSTIDRLYSSLINDIDYKDLPEAEKARDKVKACSSEAVAGAGENDCRGSLH